MTGIVRTLNEKQFHSIPNDFDIISDAAAHVGRYSSFQVVTSPTFNAADNIIDGVTKDLTGLDSLLVSGQFVLGFFESLRLATGVIIAYKAEIK